MFIIKVPGINGLGKTHGCERAGNNVLKSLEEIYSNEQGKPIDVNLLELEEIHLDNSNLELTNELIYKNSLEFFETKDRMVFLGGDHSISYSTGRAFIDYCKKQSNEGQGKEPCLIVFDAHPDCMKPSSEFPAHEEWLRGLIEQGFPCKNILLVGVRNSDTQEIEFLAKNNIRIISMNQLQENLQDSCDIIMEFARGSSYDEDNNKQREVYVSIDIDVIDPAFALGVAYAEPGGLTSRQFIYLIQRLIKVKNLKAIDLVEINEEKDVGNNNITSKLGAKILSEIL